MDFLKTTLAELKAKNLYRTLRTMETVSDKDFIWQGKKILHFSSNNYLSLANHPQLKVAAIQALEKFGCGSGASRLISGNTEMHLRLEEQLSKFKNKDAAIVFSTGYMTNIGTIPALVGPEDAVIIDRLVHASIIDGCRLSRAKFFVYPHCDTKQLEKILRRTTKFRRRLIITESVFSMDGDLAPLKEIVEVSKHYNAMLMADEAHAVGIWGKNGRGIAEWLNVENKIQITMGTLSKALGGLGGYVVGSGELIDYLHNKARSFIYTTGLPPASAATALAAIGVIKTEPQRRIGLLENAKYLRDKLTNAGWDIGNSQTQIIPLIVGEEKKTLQLSALLLEQGIFVPAIRPPTVAAGKSRLRISLMSTHTREDIDRLLALLERFKTIALL